MIRGRGDAMARLMRASQQDNLLSESMKVLLRRWFYLKFVQKKSTVELMATAGDLRNKNALSIVALLDVDEQMISQVPRAHAIQASASMPLA